MGPATGVVYASFLKSVATSSHVVFPQHVNMKSGNDHSQKLPRFDQKRLERYILLENLNHFNLNRLQLKCLIPIEHKLSL